MEPNQELSPDASGPTQFINKKLALEWPGVNSKNVIPVKSSAIDEGKSIPRKYAADGENMSPPIAWEVPNESKELVLICEDPDGPAVQAYVHWIVYGISPQITSLAEGVKPVTGAKEGINSAGTLDYTGPKPPEGHVVHNYYFQLFALNAELKVKENPNREELLKAMEGHVIASGKLVGTYER